MPWAHYSLEARRQSLARLAAGGTFEQSAPDCLDAECVADASTIRRWAWRRMASLPLWLVAMRHFFRAPTILAWDFRAAAGMLTVEPSPP